MNKITIRSFSLRLSIAILLGVIYAASAAAQLRQGDFASIGGSTGMNKPPTHTPTPTPTPTPGCASVVGNTNSWIGSGGLDTSFGIGGFSMIDVSPSSSDNVKVVLVQPDGKIVSVGSARNPNGLTGTSDLVVIRYNADGSIDTGFGAANSATPGQRLGYRFIDFSGGSDLSSSGLLDASGNIVITGFPFVKIARLNTDGDMDPSFGGGDGKIEIEIEGLIGGDIALRSDGKMLVTGGEPNFTVAQFDVDGSLDTTFGSGGSVSIDINGTKRGREGTGPIAIQWISGEERIVVGGGSATGPSAVGRFTLLRLRPNGVRDSSFGSNGVVFTTFYGLGEGIGEIEIDGQNRIVATGQTYTPCGRDAGYARYLQTGALDTSFSGDGKLTQDIYGGVNYMSSLAVQTDGKILAGGFAQYPDGSVTDFSLARLNVDGTPDSSFGPGTAGLGTVTTSAGSGNWGFGIAIQSNGYIVLGGASSSASVAVRYLP